MFFNIYRYVACSSRFIGIHATVFSQQCEVLPVFTNEVWSLASFVLFVPEQQRFTTVLARLLTSMAYDTVFSLVAVECPNVHTSSVLDERPVVGRLLFSLQCIHLFFMVFQNFKTGKKNLPTSLQKRNLRIKGRGIY